MAQSAIKAKILGYLKKITLKKITLIGTLIFILSTIFRIIPLFADCVTITSVFGNEMAIFQGICSPSPKPEQLPDINPTPTPPTPPDVIPQTEYSIFENQPQFVAFAQTHLSIQFQNIGGEEFVSLSISPQGYQSTVYAIVGGKTIEFDSSTGRYSLSVLNIDYHAKTISVQVYQQQ